jgi:hypothetical protein
LANPRVHEVANQFGIDSKIALEMLKEMGEFTRSASSSISPPVARKLRRHLDGLGYAELPLKRPREMRQASGPILIPTAEAARLLELKAGLPRTFDQMTELVTRILAGSTEPTGAKSQIPKESLGAERYVVADRPRVHLQSISDKDLPSEHGIAYIVWPAGVEVVAWATRDRLVVFHCNFVHREDGSVVMSGRRTASRQIEAGVYYVDEGRGGDTGVEKLAEIVNNIPEVQYAPSRPETPPEPVTSTKRIVPCDGDISIVYLRRQIRDGGKREAASEALKRMTRWSVRGHWRNQPYRTLGGTRRIWISPHSAGRTDAPISKRKIVYVISSGGQTARART